MLLKKFLVTAFIVLVSFLSAPALSIKSATACDQTLLTDARPVSLMNVVVVAGYSSGADLAPALRENGILNIIHVHPAAEIPNAFKPSFVAHHYSEDLVFGGDIQALVKHLTGNGRKIDAVFAGTETGVEIVDQLNRALGLKGNDPLLSDYHRNKPKMQKRIDEAGLDSILGFETNSLADALRWIDDPAKNKGRYPVVVKPVDGAGTQGFNLCFNREQVIAAFEKLLGTKTFLNIAVENVLVQKYINAEEYVVNTVSRDNKHVVGEIWHYNKIKIKRPDGGHSKIYDFDELLDFDSPEAKSLVPYAIRALGALGIEQGPSHMEIMLPEEGPVMMEMGARLMGGHTFAATRRAVGTSPLDMMIQASLFPEKFEALSKETLKRGKHVRNIQFISRHNGTVSKVNFTVEELSKLLPTYASVSSIGAGDKITPTIDLISSPGNLWLIGNTAEEVERDYRKFRDEIEPRFFEVR